MERKEDGPGEPPVDLTEEEIKQLGDWALEARFGGMRPTLMEWQAALSPHQREALATVSKGILKNVIDQLGREIAVNLMNMAKTAQANTSPIVKASMGAMRGMPKGRRNSRG